jgi:hypothetical protein
MTQPTLYTERLKLVPLSVSGPYDDLVPGAEQGEVEYEITRGAWRRNRA